MLSGLYSAATAMDLATRRHEVVAQNLAYADHPGYLRRVTSEGAFEATLGEAQSAKYVYESLGSGPTAEAVVFSQGALERTGRSLDVALQGEGFFVVDGPDGPLYTRSGAFDVNAEGQLVTVDGLPVRGTGGVITLPQNLSIEQLTVTAEGQILAEGAAVGQLDVVAFDRPEELVSAGVSLFRAPPGTDSIASDARIVQGARERSNVSAMLEMVRMIDGMRQYEAASRALQTIAHAIEQHVNPQAG